MNPDNIMRRVISIAIITALSCFSILCIASSIAVWRGYKAISPAIARLNQTTENLAIVSEQAKEVSANSATFVRQFTDETHRTNLDEYIKLQLQHTRHTASYGRQAAREIRGIIKDTREILETDIKQLIATANVAVAANSRALLATNDELRKQIATNGGQTSLVLTNATTALETANATLLTANQLLSSVKDTTLLELNNEIEQLSKLTSHLTVLAGDPEIANAIKSLSQTSANIEVITADLSTLTGRLARPQPPKNAFDKYVVRPAGSTLRLLVLGGQLALVFRQF
jgi:hypothetical protein